MGDGIQTTSWPDIIVAPSTKALINRFFSLLDDEDPGVGDVLATEIFENDAEVQFGSQTFKGCEGKHSVILSLVDSNLGDRDTSKS